MWALANRTAYAAERTWVRDRDGNHLWIVAVKATYAVSELGTLSLADQQRPPVIAPEYLGEPGASSLRYDTDLLEPKPTTDVVLNATAYAPRGVPARTVEVAVRIHDVQKTLLVHGPRVYWDSPLGLKPSAPVPFVQHPIVYEWAFGGSDKTDPDVARRAASLVEQPAHRIENPRAPAAAAGLGAIASHWSPRVELGGTYDAEWNKSRRPLLPTDYDPRSRLCAPADQHPRAHLSGGETIALVNLTPSGFMAFTIPKVALEFTTHFGGGKRTHRASLGTVVVEPDDRRVMLVWQTGLPVGPRDLDYLDATVISERAA
jgi:hypothetical protein